MGQIVTLNGRWHDLDYEPSLKVNTQRDFTPIEINGKMIHGVNINGYDYPPADPSCVLYFPGLPGQGSKIWDRSKEGNDGTITGAIWIRLPSGLWCLSFDGSDDRVDTALDIFSEADFASGLTLEVWVKPAALPTTHDIHILSIEARIALIIQITTNKLALQIYDGASNNVVSNAAAVTGTWYHLVGTWDGSNMLVFVNGTQQTDTNTSNVGIIDAVNRVTSVGRNPANLTVAQYHLNGSVVLSKIYNRTLSAQEVQNRFNQVEHLFGI